MGDKVKKVVGLTMIAFGVTIAVLSSGVAAGAAAKLIGAGLVIGFSKKPKLPAATTMGAELQLSGDPLDVRSIIYGEAWTAGTLRYRNSTGTDNRDLYIVIVLAGHEIDSVQAVEADRQTLTLDGSGNVTSPSNWVGKMNVRFVSGTDSQSADSTLDTAFVNWTSNHRLRGLAYAIVKLSYDETNLSSVPAFRFKVRGRKVYDPRLDSTNGGSGSHRLATPSTWAWSRNPVLCANDFLRGVKINSINIAGLGLGTARFDWANVIAEANVCEENVSLAAGGTEDRYTCDGVIDPRQTPAEILRHFELAIAGDIIPSDGKWRFFAGAYRAPTLHLQPQHFIGPLKHVAHKGELERYDTAEGSYASLAESGAVVNYSPVRLSTATTGSERLVNLDFQLVADTTDSGGVYDGGARAQRIAKLLLEKEAAGKQITLRCSLYALRCMPGETVQITHAAFGLSAQTMRVMEVQLVTIRDGDKTGLAVDLTLEAGPSSLYTWSATEVAMATSPSLPSVPVTPIQTPWTPVLVNVSRSTGNTFTKTAGAASTFDASVYSVEGYARGAVGFTIISAGYRVAVGLDASPSGSNSYTGIDYGWLVDPSTGSKAYVVENGATMFDAGARSNGDRLEVVCTGTKVSYYINGVLQYASSRSVGALYLDSSFYAVGDGVMNLTFTQLEQVATEQIDPEAATDVGSSAAAGPVTAAASESTDEETVTSVTLTSGGTTDVFEVSSACRTRWYTAGGVVTIYSYVMLQYRVNSGAWTNLNGMEKPLAASSAVPLTATVTGVAAGSTIEVRILVGAVESGSGGTGTLYHEATDASLLVTQVKR